MQQEHFKSCLCLKPFNNLDYSLGQLGDDRTELSFWFHSENSYQE
jgi:hypothetical protein